MYFVPTKSSERRPALWYNYLRLHRSSLPSINYKQNWNKLLLDARNVSSLTFVEIASEIDPSVPGNQDERPQRQANWFSAELIFPEFFRAFPVMFQKFPFSQKYTIQFSEKKSIVTKKDRTLGELNCKPITPPKRGGKSPNNNVDIFKAQT